MQAAPIVRRSLTLAAALLLGGGQVSAQEASPDSVTRLDEIVVTVSRTPESTRSLTASVTSVGRSQFERRFAGTADRALQDVPGVSVVGDATFGQEVRLNVRGLNSGFGTQRTLVLLDGRPLTDEYLGHTDLAQFPTALLERIELVRGPASAAYGSNAMGGVLNLIPLRGGGQRAGITTSGGTFATVAPSGFYGQRIGRVDALLGVSAQSTDGYLRNSRGQAMDWEARNALLNAGVESGRVAARFYGLLFDGGGTDEDFDRDLTRASQDVDLTVRLDERHDAVAGVRLWHSHLSQRQNWFEAPASHWRQRTLGGILTQRYVAGPLLSLLGGVEVRRLDIEVNEVTANVDRASTLWGVFLQDQLKLGGRVNVLLGVRGDGRPGGGVEPSYRAGVNVAATEQTTLIAAVGRAFRVPTVSDRFLPRTSFFGLEFEGNSDLEPESSLSAEIGLRHAVSRDIGLDLTAFATDAEGFWDFLPGEDGVLRPQNIARVTVRGVEAAVSSRIGSQFDVGLAYTFTDARYDEFTGLEQAVGNRIDDNVHHTVAASGSWTAPAGHAARFALRGVGDRVTDPLDPPDSRLPGFIVADLTVTGAIVPGLRLNGGILNIFDRKYRLRPEFPQPGRALVVGATYDWQ